MDILRYRGQEGRAISQDLANLRVRVFAEYPYLYEGTADYEESYLETYFRAKDSFVLALRDGGRIVGATTGIALCEEEESFQKPLKDFGFDPARVFYFGESVLLPEYRGRGFGKLFFAEREAFANRLGSIEHLAFCAVQRASTHPLKPEGYKPLDQFWQSQGFRSIAGLIAHYEWLDRGESSPSSKPMQFWMKNIGVRS